MRGKWLKEAGFEINSYIVVEIEQGRLVITKDVYREREKILNEIKELDEEKKMLENYLEELPMDEQLDLFQDGESR